MIIVFEFAAIAISLLFGFFTFSTAGVYSLEYVWHICKNKTRRPPVTVIGTVIYIIFLFLGMPMNPPDIKAVLITASIALVLNLILCAFFETPKTFRAYWVATITQFCVLVTIFFIYVIVLIIGLNIVLMFN